MRFLQINALKTAQHTVLKQPEHRLTESGRAPGHPESSIDTVADAVKS